MSQTPYAAPPAVASRERAMPYSHVRGLKLLLLATVLFGVALRIYFFDPGLARSPDERTYNRQANIVLTQGPAGFHFLEMELLRDPALISGNPSPTRAGYLALLAAYMQVTGDHSILAGAQLSLIISCAALLLMACTAYRVLSPVGAIAAMLYYAVLPFELTTSRRAWQDSFIAFLALAIVALAIDIARSCGVRRVAGMAAFFLLGVFAITTKENMAAFFLLCAAGLTVHFLLKHDRRAAIATATCAAMATFASLSILGSLFGGLAGYVALEREFIHYSGIGPYELAFNTGPMWMFPAGFFRASPVLVLAALAGLAICLLRAIRSHTLANSNAALGIALLSFATILIQLVTQRYNFRYTAPAYGPICLLAGIGIESIVPPLNKLLAPLGRPIAWATIAFALSVGAFHDLNFARDNLLPPGIQDMALRIVLGVPPAPLPPTHAH